VVLFFSTIIEEEDQWDNAIANKLLQNILKLVSQEMNSFLSIPFNEEEIKSFISCICGDKSPSPYGILTLFL